MYYLVPYYPSGVSTLELQNTTRPWLDFMQIDLVFELLEPSPGNNTSLPQTDHIHRTTALSPTLDGLFTKL